MCYHVYVIGAHKRTHVDYQNMPNHCTSIYHEWMCVCVAALKVIVTRYTAQSVMRTCMLPRELIWERVAPSHTGVTQNSGWPLLQLLWSAPEKAQSLMWCAISNVVSFKFKFKSIITDRNITNPITGLVVYHHHHLKCCQCYYTPSCSQMLEICLKNIIFLRLLTQV